MRSGIPILGLLAGFAVAGSAEASSFIVSYEPEAPKLQTSITSATFKVSGVENFETSSAFNGTSDVTSPLAPSSNVAGKQSYLQVTTDFGTNGQITGVYDNVQVIKADVYGGAGGTGQYAVSFGGDRGAPYSLTLSAAPGVSVNYFGYWLSALDKGNTLTFYEAGQQVFKFTAADVLSAISKIPDNGAYYGNPNPSNAGDGGEPFVFLNFFDKTGSFDKIVFSEVGNGTAGYETDNHTVGFDVINPGNGVVIPTGVPEPAAWALMIIGVGGVGAALRRRRALHLARTA